MKTTQLADCISARRCSAFPSELLGSFPTPTPEEIAARELAEDYHRVTEEFDRSVCTGPIVNGSIRPACTYEIAKINRFARQAYAHRLEGAIQAGATRKQFHDAVIAAADRMQNPRDDRAAHLVRGTVEPVVGGPND